AMILCFFIVMMNCVIGGQVNDMNGIWIDVRTAKEYKSGHIEDAINIPYKEIGREIESVTKNKSEKIFLYCKSGRRSAIAKELLDKMGYINVINAGGYEEIKKRQNKTE
ncbi:MAG: rhodanese-like domain-containing protein, partial [Candidatus Kuenenia sp.]|nr:rhodanese-like domain-containing protein [Candidatus Kuenenia sp.]